MLFSKGKFEYIDVDKLVNDKISERKTNEILIIVPTNRQVRSLTKYLIDKSKFNAVANLKIHTLSTLSTLLFDEMINNEYFILDDATAIIKLKKIFSESDLKYFPKNQEITKGILFEVKNVITEFKKKGISVDLLRKDLEVLPSTEINKAKDLILIFERYQKECSNMNLFELGDIYEFINGASKDNFNKSFRELFPDIDTVLIKGFDELSLLEIKIINSVFELVPNSFISFDIYPDNIELFSHPIKTINKLKTLGFNEINESKALPSSSFIQILQKNLFTLKPEIQQSDIELFLYSAQNRNDEISFIAKSVKKLINESKYKIEDICVVFNQISTYATIINEIFSDYNIPFNLTDRFLLSNSPPVISIINLLMILENNFYYNNIFRAISGDWISIQKIDKNNLLKVSANLKIISGLNNWERKIDKILEDIDNNPESDFNYLPKESYLKAKQDILTIAKILEPFNSKLTPSEFLKRMNHLIYELEIVSKAVNSNESYTEKNTRAIIAFAEMLQNIIKILEIENGNKKHSLSFYLDNIKSALQFTRYNVKEKPGVLITSVDEIRGLNFKVLILGGLVDGEFPTKYSPELFIPEKYKLLEEGHLYKERYKFYQALSVAKEQIILTYPKSHDNTELTASSFLNDLEAVANCKNVRKEDYELLICSPYELKKNVGIENLKQVDSEILREHNIVLSDLIRKSEIDYQRRNIQSDKSEYSGYLDIHNDKNIQSYIEKFSSQQSYSASKLEEYVKCPFQFLMKRILKLQPYKEPIEEVEAFEIGTLIHSILYEFYIEIQKKNLNIENCTDEEFEKLSDLIFEIAEKKVKKENFSNTFSFFELEKILGINGNKKYSILYSFLEEERKPKKGFTPLMFEKKFGKYSGFPEVQHNGINLQGTIDRIEVNIDKKLFSVIDYKLRGKSITKDDINEGISLQLPLYLFAVKKILEAEFKDSYEPFSAEIYSLKIFNQEFGRKIIHNSSSKNLDAEELIKINNAMIDIFTKTVEKCVEKIKNGEFNLSTLKDREQKVCSYCDFISICRVQEII